VTGGVALFSAAHRRLVWLSLATVRPRDAVGRTRRQLAAELITELAVIDRKIKQANAALTELIAATGSSYSSSTG
jgi:hypothetical protein